MSDQQEKTGRNSSRIQGLIDRGLESMFQSFDEFVRKGDMGDSEFLAIVEDLGGTDLHDMYEEWIREGTE